MCPISRRTTIFRNSVFVIAVFLGFFVAFTQNVEAQSCCPSGFVAGEVIVGFAPGTTGDRVSEIASAVGASVIRLIFDWETGPAYLMDVPVGKELIFASLFESYSEVRYAEPDHIMCIPELPPCDCCPLGLICPFVFPCPVVDEPNISVSPVSQDFGPISIGSSAFQVFEISNTGGADIVIGTVTLSGTDFTIKQGKDTCSGKTVLPSGKCTGEVIFSPTTEGLKNANLSIPSNDPDTPSLVVTLTGEGTLQPVFDDCQEDFWACDFIDTLYYSGITGGCSTNPLRFCPDQLITRGQMTVFLITSLRRSSNTCKGRFVDVPIGHLFCGFIERLADDEITGGCSVNPPKFCPDDPVTRCQMAVFVEAALGNPPNTCVERFPDVPILNGCCGFVEKLDDDGITGGCGGSNFCPIDPVTRAQMAVFLVAAPEPLSP